MNTDKEAVTGARTVAHAIRADVALNCERPNIGDLCTVRGLMCKVTKVFPFGTIEVISIDEHNTNKAYRVSGLAFL